MSNSSSDQKRLFFIRKVRGDIHDLSKIVHSNSFSHSNLSDGRNTKRIEFQWGHDDEREYEFSVPWDAIPVYPQIGTWGNIEQRVNTKSLFPSEKVWHIIIVEVPPHLINDPDKTHLFINVPVSESFDLPMSMRVKVEGDEVLPWFDFSQENIAPELFRRLETDESGRTTFNHTNGMYGEGYIIDEGQHIKFSELPEVRIYKEQRGAVELEYHAQEGKVLFTVENTEGKIRGEGDTPPPGKGKERR